MIKTLIGAPSIRRLLTLGESPRRTQREFELLLPAFMLMENAAAFV
jgi:hypothetical protein